MCVGLFSLAAAASLGMQPQDDQEAAAVFPVWWSQGRAVDAAARAGAIVAVGAAPFVVVARSETSDIAAALKAEGAWLIIDPGLAAACGAKD
jgi:hypothetical protein